MQLNESLPLVVIQANPWCFICLAICYMHLQKYNSTQYAIPETLICNIPWMRLSNSFTAGTLALEQARCSGVRFRRYSWATNRCLTLSTSVCSSNWITSWLVDIVSAVPSVSVLLREPRGSWQAATCNGVRPSLVRALRSSFSGVHRRVCVCTFCVHVCDERQSFHNINIIMTAINV